MRCEYHLRTLPDCVTDGRQGPKDPGIVGNNAVLNRNVEINAYKNTFAGNINISNSLLVHCVTICWQ